MRILGRQGWIPGRGRLLSSIAGPGKLTPTPFNVDFFGLRFAGNTASLIDWSVFFLGAYSREELDLLGDLVPRFRRARGSANFYDVGANVGNHTLYMSQRADLVAAFEPYPPNRQRLVGHVESNGLKNVMVFADALGNRNGEAAVAVYDGDNHGGAGIVVRGGETVSIRRGDDLAREAGLPRMDILKIDVEGYESEVLAGFRETILRDRPAILLELLGENRSGFKNTEGLVAAVYPRYRLYSVRRRRVALGKSYRLEPFVANAAEVLCLPEEL